MIVCVRCGDTCGPWVYIEGEGMVCEDCLEAEEKEESNDRQ